MRMRGRVILFSLLSTAQTKKKETQSVPHPCVLEPTTSHGHIYVEGCKRKQDGHQGHALPNIQSDEDLKGMHKVDKPQKDRKRLLLPRASLGLDAGNGKNPE